MAFTSLDGGRGQELVHRGGRATPLWSTEPLLGAPNLVRAVQDDFFAAGADVATTNTNAVRPDRLAPHGHGPEDQLDALTRRACAFSAAARDAAGGGLVAGSLGQPGFSCRPDLAPPFDRAVKIHARVAAVQAEVVDVLLLETMSSVDEARGGPMGVLSTGKSV